MILSNRKLKLIITCLLLTIFLYFISIFDVKASAFSDLEIHTITGSSQQKTYNASPSSGNVTIALFDGINISVGDDHDYLLIPGNFNVIFYDATSSSVTVLSPGSDFSIAPLVQFNGQKTVVCELDNNMIVCPITDVGLTNLHVTSVSLVVNYIAYSNRILTARYQIFGNWYVGNLPGKTISQNTSDINNSINSSEVDNDNANSSYSQFGEKANSSMQNSPVSNLVTLPITFLQGVTNAISGSCTNVNYIELYGYQLVLPCLNLAERLGSVWVIIDTILSAMLLFSIGKSLVVTFARLSDMDTNIMYEAYAHKYKEDEIE